MLLPYKTNKLFKVFKWAGDSSEPHGTNPTDIEETTDLNEADIVTSMMRTDKLGFSAYRPTHTFVVDLDTPATLVPSSTPGHSHLYIDTPMTWDRYLAVLEAMAAAGILERGYVGASKARGFTAVRLPWVRRNARRKRPLPGPVFSGE